MVNFHEIHKIGRMIVTRSYYLHHIISVNAFGGCLDLTLEFYVTGTSPTGRATIVVYFIEAMTIMKENFTISISYVLSKCFANCGRESNFFQNNYK